GVEANAKDKSGDTPMHWATHHVDKMKWLLEQGADINAKDNRGQTPLSVAVTMPGETVKQWLRANGAK
ncbi:MAG: ankyrin repeat domain-containing protein, partial [Phycisphaerales bacterium]|nr:ankyrin repeat domain-containing protein [Phycisphaerales bacterium]